MDNKHNTKKSSTCPNQTHLGEVEYLVTDSKNPFKVPSDFISSQSIKRYPPKIPTQPTLDPSYTSSPNTPCPHKHSSSNK